MKKKIIDPRLLGFFILIVVAAGTVFAYRTASQRRNTVKLEGYLGGEKIGFFEDPQVGEILKDRYQVEMDYSRAGSLEMVTLDQTGRDYLFPSSQTALEYYREERGEPLASEIILNTPIVLYTHSMVADALEKAGLITWEGETGYVDMRGLTDLILRGASWEELGLPQLYGPVTIETTDPSKSNSGNMFAGLLANTLNGGQTVNRSTVGGVLPQLKEIFARLGYMETSSSDLFSQFLKMGVGAKPIIAGYESQLLEFAVEQPEDFAQIKEDIVMLYPSPTVWSTHVYIALTENGRKAVDGLLDEEVQRLAWEKHGFRTNVYLAASSAEAFGVRGLAPEITRVMPMPDYQTMRQIIDGL